MLVPVYLELADGNIFFLGRARVAGNRSIEQKVPLKGLKTKPRATLLSYYDDILAAPDSQQTKKGEHTGAPLRCFGVKLTLLRRSCLHSFAGLAHF
jgi:hypothetical protein